jgi:hypothetical protein
VSAPEALAQLPEVIRIRLSGGPDTRDRCAIELVTADGVDWPHIAHLSVGEILVREDGLMRAALWSTSESCALLIRNPRTSLFFTGPESLFEVRCVATAHKKLPTAKPLTGFLLKPVDVRDKRAPYATLLSGIQFALHSTREIEAQWKEARQALLRTFPDS